MVRLVLLPYPMEWDRTIATTHLFQWLVEPQILQMTVLTATPRLARLSETMCLLVSAENEIPCCQVSRSHFSK